MTTYLPPHYTALVPLIDGFEEIEAIAVIDILRRAEIEVITAGVEQMLVTGSHKIQVAVDRPFADMAGRDFDVLVLPGGPGVPRLGKVPAIRAIVQRHFERGHWVAAICAAPSILADVGILGSSAAACHPTVESRMGAAKLQKDPVVVDGRFITSRGAGTAVLFALEIVRRVVGEEKAAQIARQICEPFAPPAEPAAAPKPQAAP